MSLRNALFASLCVLVTLGLSVPAQSQAWPQRPVKIIYPYAPGTASDAAARLLAQRFGEVFGQPFIVENRPGANGTVAAEAVARSSADGYTLLWAATPQMAISPAMSKVSYDPVKDFVAISAVLANSFALVVNPKMPIKTVAEFVDYVRARPNKLVYAEGGFGSIGHLSMALFLNRAALEMTNVSCKGNAPALTDVIAGHLPAMFSVLADAQEQANSGGIRLLAVTSANRSPRVPDMPTVSESGFPGFKTESWNGLMGPAGTPKPIVDRIAAEVIRATREPKFVDQLINFGVDPLGTSPAQFASMISADIEQWAEAVRIAGLKHP
jgi:tripartite-type tricarboxylate transporter receptor subunit TctC